MGATFPKGTKLIHGRHTLEVLRDLEIGDVVRDGDLAFDGIPAKADDVMPTWVESLIKWECMDIAGPAVPDDTPEPKCAPWWKFWSIQ